MQLITGAPKKRLASLHPEAAAELAALEQALDDTGLDPALLGLCRAYIDATLREAGWQAPAGLTDRDRVCLAFCEQFMVSVEHVSDAHVAALRVHLTPDEVYLFSNAVYLIEMSTRLELTLEAALS